jgi:predicted nucleic acid-binding protein
LSIRAKPGLASGGAACPIRRIAAHDLDMGSILVTQDKAFARVKGLKIADWTKP